MIAGEKAVMLSMQLSKNGSDLMKEESLRRLTRRLFHGETGNTEQAQSTLQEDHPIYPGTRENSPKTYTEQEQEENRMKTALYEFAGLLFYGSEDHYF